MGKPASYWDYIRTEELLALQGGLEGDESRLTNDEVVFVVVHQVDELWFKLLLRELVAVRDLLARETVPEQALASAVRSLRRGVVLLHQLTAQFELMETLTTRDYLNFRDKLSPASGFQSAGLREIEVLLGLTDAERLPLGPGYDFKAALRGEGGEATPALARVEARERDLPTLRGALDAWLARTPIQGSRPGDPDDEAVVTAFLDAYLQATADAMRAAGQGGERLERGLASARAYLLAEDAPPHERALRRRVRAALVFIESYRELPLLAWPRELLDALVALEQAMTVFRARHARMVERVIGRRAGTGGSAGVAYLDQTALTYRVFSDLWAARTLLLPEDALPPLQRAERYGVSPGQS